MSAVRGRLDRWFETACTIGAVIVGLLAITSLLGGGPSAVEYADATQPVTVPAADTPTEPVEPVGCDKATWIASPLERDNPTGHRLWVVSVVMDSCWYVTTGGEPSDPDVRRATRRIFDRLVTSQAPWEIVDRSAHGRPSMRVRTEMLDADMYRVVGQIAGVPEYGQWSLSQAEPLSGSVDIEWPGGEI